MARDEASTSIRRVKLPVSPPLEPMLSKRAADVPEGPGFVFEPKWDGFRTIVFRDGNELLLQSRDTKPMGRYFPELEAPLLAALPERAVLDGEIVLATGEGLDFEALQGRIHPAASRVAMLAKTMPTSIVFWDVLALGDEESILSVPFGERDARSSSRSSKAWKAPIHVTPATTDREGRPGLVPPLRRSRPRRRHGEAREHGGYEPGKRAMWKVKHERTCDCAVAGFRWHKDGEGKRIGSLLLGLNDDDGKLHHVGVTASFTDAKRRELVDFLAPYRENAGEGHPWSGWMGEDVERTTRKPGAVSRWSRGKNLSWEPLRVELVVEVGYDHMQGSRFRHTAQFKRWRVDKTPAACRYDQLEVTPPFELRRIFEAEATSHG